MSWYDERDDKALNRRILRGNLDRNYPQLGAAEKAEALKVAEAAFHGNVSNGQATDIGARYVLGRRETG